MSTRPAMRSRRSRSILFAGLFALAAIGFDAPAVGAATDQLQDRSVSTYELQPARGVIHVTMAFSLTNKAPSTSRSRSCTALVFYPGYGYILVPATCTTRTNYYYNSYNFWVERDAQAFKVKADTGSAKVKLGKKSGLFRDAKVTFSPLFYGKTRRISITYDLPAGGPRTTTERKAGYVHASFCAYGPGTQQGSLRVVVPVGFDMTVTPPMTAKVTGVTKVYSTANLKQPWKFSACFTGTDPTGFAVTSQAIAAGPTVNVESWKEDTIWAGAVQSSVQGDLPALTKTLGSAPFGTALKIHEEATDAAGLDRYDPVTGTLHLSEAAVTRADVTHRLAALWFDKQVFWDPWMVEGYTAWAEHQAGVSDTPCTKPGTYPGSGQVDLKVWPGLGSSPTQTDLDVAAYKRQAACYIVTTLADAMGPDRMGDVLGAMRSGSDAFSPAGAPLKRARLNLSTRDWLDIVEQRGLVPAGADPELATTLLTAYGIPSSRDDLGARATALAAYRALLSQTGQPAPAPVTAALTDWQYPAAQTAMSSASDAWTTADTTATTLPGVVVRGAAVQQAVAAAQTQADLDAARMLATRQLALATAATSTLALEAAPRDTIQQLGLAGTTLPDGALAIDAVSRIDAAAATAFKAQVDATIGGAHDVGVQRLELIGGTVATVLLLLVLAFVLIRRSRRGRRRRALAAVGPVADGPEMQPPDEPGSEEPMPAEPPTPDDP